jgi:hypothetical protein
MAPRTWRDRLRELNTQPRPPEIDPDRLEFQIAVLRHNLAHPLGVGGPKVVYSEWAWVDPPDEGRREREQQATTLARLARLEAELALLRRLGPRKGKPRGKR